VRTAIRCKHQLYRARKQDDEAPGEADPDTWFDLDDKHENIDLEYLAESIDKVILPSKSGPNSATTYVRLTGLYSGPF
jgi:hypothetical protein